MDYDAARVRDGLARTLERIKPWPHDSSELIDMPAAGKLGLHRGLLFLEEEGTVEKFRPYASFADDWLAAVARALGSR